MGVGAPPPPENAVGLRGFTIESAAIRSEDIGDEATRVGVSLFQGRPPVGGQRTAGLILILVAALLMQQPASSDRDLQRIAMEGWAAARSLAPKGGAVELLGPVNLHLKALDAFADTSARYAEIAIRAAVSAAQEERDELALLLAHARDLSNQMALDRRAGEWPLPIDELEGELWFEVDRFAEARDAYERATQATPDAECLDRPRARQRSARRRGHRLPCLHHSGSDEESANLGRD